MPKPRVLYWFRTDLRLHDSPALEAALDLGPECLYPVWTWDPHYVYHARVGPNRWQFLIDCQNDLSASLTKLNPASRLLVVREAPQTLLPKLFKAWRISHLVFEKDTDAYARERDDKVTRLAQDAGVQVVVRSGRTLYGSDELVKANGGKPTMSITQVQQAGKKLGPISRPIPAPTSLPSPGDLTLDFEQDRPTTEPDLNAVQRSSADKSYASLAGPDNSFSVPTLSELGMEPATTPHRGGETLALANLAATTSNTAYTALFSKPLTAPTAFAPPSTTLLSPHLHFGALSVRTFYWAACDAAAAYEAAHGKGSATPPPTSLPGQLLFRDMYFGAQAALGHRFGQAFGNSHCRWIPWHLPSEIDAASGLRTGAHAADSAQAQEWLARWRDGRTGFPFVDALMRQLRRDGWIHHLGRHMVACFLTRGGCYVDWERGADVFEEWLLDHEAASNIGNWQWLACAAFYAQFHRCYSPVAFGRKWDPDGAFVRAFVPELARMPARWLYEPWKAPVRDQRLAGCLVRGDAPGRDGDYRVYPKPMFDFAERRDACIRAISKAYRVGLYGNDPRVLDGSWRRLFDDGAEGPTEGVRALPAAVLGRRGSADGGEEEGRRGRGRAREQVGGGEHAASSPAGTNGAGQRKKRAAGQTTLDGIVKKVKK